MEQTEGLECCLQSKLEELACALNFSMQCIRLLSTRYQDVLYFVNHCSTFTRLAKYPWSHIFTRCCNPPNCIRNRSHIRTEKTEKPVAAHFCQPDHSIEDLEVRRIKKTHQDTLISCIKTVTTRWFVYCYSYCVFQIFTCLKKFARDWNNAKFNDIWCIRIYDYSQVNIHLLTDLLRFNLIPCLS